jgi:hypothetical protein
MRISFDLSPGERLSLSLDRIDCRLRAGQACPLASGQANAVEWTNEDGNYWGPTLFRPLTSSMQHAGDRPVCRIEAIESRSPTPERRRWKSPAAD